MIRLSEFQPRGHQDRVHGLRPGEKLYEELLSDGRRARLPTPHPQVAHRQSGRGARCKPGLREIRNLALTRLGSPADERGQAGIGIMGPRVQAAAEGGMRKLRKG